MTRRSGPGGVAYSIDCYRTVNGVRYLAWSSCASAEEIANYRKAGLRCRRFGGELFMHPDDEAKANQVDYAANPLPDKRENL